MTQLYDREQLVFTKNFLGRTYWVARIGTVSPLFTLHKVPRKLLPMAFAFFKDHPQGVRPMTPQQLRSQIGDYWSPEQSVEDCVEQESVS